MNNEFDCPKCGKVTPTALYYSFPMQADCPKCGARLEQNDSLKVLSEEEGRKLRPQLYEKKATPEEIARVREQLEKTPNDPNFTITLCNCFRFDEKDMDSNDICKTCPVKKKK